MSVFTLKKNDTRPILEVVLNNPDKTVHDLTGSTSYKLNIRVGAVVLTRTMVVQGLPTEGTLRYTWLTTDWDTGNLIVGEHNMEYEVLGPTGERLTFPNNGFDTLSIRPDLL